MPKQMRRYSELAGDSESTKRVFRYLKRRPAPAMPLASFDLKLMASHTIRMVSEPGTYFFGAPPETGLYRPHCSCGWCTAELHTHAEALRRARNHVDAERRAVQAFDWAMDEVPPPEYFQRDELDILYNMAPYKWRSVDGKIWLINPGSIPPDDTPLMAPTHAQKCIDHLRRRQIQGPFTEEQDRRFENAPIIKAFRKRVAEAGDVEWRDAKWHDWMYEKKHGVRPG